MHKAVVRTLIILGALTQTGCEIASNNTIASGNTANTESSFGTANATPVPVAVGQTGPTTPFVTTVNAGVPVTSSAGFGEPPKAAISVAKIDDQSVSEHAQKIQAALTQIKQEPTASPEPEPVVTTRAPTSIAPVAKNSRNAEPGLSASGPSNNTKVAGHGVGIAR